jgi:hypothetical protein
MSGVSNSVKREVVDESWVIGARVPTRQEIVENPRRAWFIGGGWIDSSDPSVINLYWHRRQKLFTVYSLLQVLEHETLHSVLARIAGLETSQKLDRVHRSVCVWLDEERLVFVNEIRVKEWVFPLYVREPNEELLE